MLRSEHFAVADELRMHSHRRWRTGVALLLMAAAPTLASLRSVTAAAPVAELAVIVHPQVDEKRLEIDDLRAIFLRRRLAWSADRQIVPFNHPNGSPTRAAFDRAVLGFSAEQAARYWIDARIRSGLQAPRTVTSDAMMLNVVKILPGSIGYVAADRVTAAVRVVARVGGGRVFPP